MGGVEGRGGANGALGYRRLVLSALSYPLEIVCLFGGACVLGTMLVLAWAGRSELLIMSASGVIAATGARTFLACGVVATVVSILAYSGAFFCRFVAPRVAELIVLVLLLFYAVSYYFILLGWRALWGQNGVVDSLVPGSVGLPGIFDYGVVALLSVMVLRYLPIGLLLVYLRMKGFRIEQYQAARNLGLTRLQVHTKVLWRWTAPAVGLVWGFCVVLAAVDYLASSLAGGGRVQTLANLIDDWQRSSQLQGAAMGLGLLFVVAVALLSVAGLRLVNNSVGESGVFSEENLPIETTLAGRLVGASGLAVPMAFEASLFLALGFLAFGGRDSFPSTVSIGAALGSAELLGAIGMSLRIAAVAVPVGMVLVVASVFGRHRAPSGSQRSRVGLFGKSLSDTVLLLPLVVPPILSGVASGAFQGLALRWYGSWLSVAVLHVISFAPLGYFVLLGAASALSSESFAAAKNLGVPGARYFFRVFAPGSRGGILAAAVLILCFSLNDSILCRYVGGFDRSLGLLIADRQVASLGPEHFLSVLALSLVTGLLLCGAWVIVRRGASHA